ncbi:hypothetical protein, partial [Thiolapillus sp.]|uniref:hypothetical protein n=4 Tax=Thiolapillus sp. TaxID=2017437 RepID=UPI0025F3560B
LYSQLLSYKLYPAHQEFPSNFSMFFYVNSIGWHFWMDTNYLNMKNLIQVERGCMICSINIWLRAVAVHFSTPLRLYQPYACATDTDGEGQKNGQKLTHQISVSSAS